MSKDTRFWATLPAGLGFAVAAAMLTPVVQANTESEDPSQQQTSAESSEMQQSSGALSQLAEQESDISKFVEAVEKAGMAESLTSGTQYTIFAPTNDALESSDVKQLLESSDPQDQEELVNILRAHIVADDVDPEMAKTIGKAKTVGGGEIELTSEGEKLQVGGNEVVKADIQQDNLRVYTIDGVLEPTASASMASSGQSGETGSMASADFDQLDQDGDGYLNEEELQAQQQLAAEQDQIDSDQDGRVSRTEFSAFEQENMPSAADPQSTTDESSSESQQNWPSDEQR